MPDTPILFPSSIASATGKAATGSQVSVDDTGRSHVQADNVQELLAQLDSLAGVVDGFSPGGGSRIGGSLTPFTSSVTVTDANIESYDNELAIYVRSDDARVNFLLPTDAHIATAGASYPVTIVVLHQGGTRRITTGFEPSNTIVVDTQGGEAFQQPPGRNVAFSELHQFDLGTYTKTSAGSGWVGEESTLTQGALLLPDGVFNLKPNITINADPARTSIILSASLVTVQSGDAFRVATGNSDFGAAGVSENDVLVATIDNPSFLNNSSNTDWLRIQNAGNSDLNNTQFAFLNTISDSTRNVDSRLSDETGITDVRVYVSSAELTNAPFTTPSTDTVNNPTDADGLRIYYGGDEDTGPDDEFSAVRDYSSSFIYLDIDGTIATEVVPETYVLFVDGYGVTRFSFDLPDSFDAVTLTGGGGDTYYVLNFNDVVAGPDTITVFDGWTIEVVRRRERVIHSIDDSVDVSEAIPRRSIGFDELETVVTDAIVRPASDTPVPVIPENIQTLGEHLEIAENVITGWRVRDALPGFEFVREGKFLDGVSRANLFIDQYDDQDGAEITGIDGVRGYVYNDNSRHENSIMPGYDSFLYGDAFDIDNKAPFNSIGSGNNKMGGFVYSNGLELPSDSTDILPVLSFGTGEPLLAFSRQNGLHVRVRTGSGAVRTRTHSDGKLTTVGNQWHSEIDTGTHAVETLVYGFATLGDGPVTVQVPIHLDNNGNDEGTPSVDVVIDDLNSAQTISGETYSFGAGPTLTVNFVYGPAVTLNGITSRLLRVQLVGSVSNAAYTYTVGANHRVTDTWTVGTSYGPVSINPVDAHDRFNDFQDGLWQLERVPVMALWAIQNYRIEDTDTDPEQSYVVLVKAGTEPVRAYSGRTNRPLSDFTFDDPKYDASQVAIADVENYRFTPPTRRQFTEAEARVLFASFADNLGLATNRVDAVETFRLNGNLEIAPGFGIIQTDTDDSIRKTQEISSGAIAIKNA